MNLKSKIYEGTLFHARTKPVKHSFSFPLYTFVLDLDELEVLDKNIRFFGYNVYSYPLAITYEHHIAEDMDDGKHYFKILFDF